MRFLGTVRSIVAASLMLALNAGYGAAQTPARPPKSKPAAPTTSVSGAAKVDAMLGAMFDNMHVITDMHYHKGEYNHIVNISRMAVAANPDDLDMYADAGWLLWSMNRDAEAVALYEQGIKANPNSYYMLDELGQYYSIRKKDWPHAVQYLEQAAQKPDSTEITLHMLAHAYEKNKQLDKALATWARVLKHNDAGPARSNYDRIKKMMASQRG